MSIACSLVPSALLIGFVIIVQVFVFPATQGPASWLVSVGGLIIQL